MQQEDVFKEAENVVNELKQSGKLRVLHEAKKAIVELEYQPYIAGPPLTQYELMQRSASADGPTMERFRNDWIENVKKNHAIRGPFAHSHIGQLYQTGRFRPGIICGSGPSITKNAHEIKKAKGIPVISCLHNFHYFEDNEIPCDYYVTLDAQDVTLTEMAEGGTRSLEEYIELTKDKTLLAYVGCSHKLIQNWKGKIYWFSAPIDDPKVMIETNAIERFNIPVMTGGNVLGACFYIAKAVLGCNPIIFTGADFSFGYDKKFYGWNNNTDKNGIGQTLKVTDIFGMKVHTWGSYQNFKSWFENKCCSIPGFYINATEGGILGAYDHGNIQQIHQMDLKKAIYTYTVHDALAGQFDDPAAEKAKMVLM